MQSKLTEFSLVLVGFIFTGISAIIWGRYESWVIDIVHQTKSLNILHHIGSWMLLCFSALFYTYGFNIAAEAVAQMGGTKIFQFIILGLIAAEWEIINLISAMLFTTKSLQFSNMTTIWSLVVVVAFTVFLIAIRELAVSLGIQ